MAQPQFVGSGGPHLLGSSPGLGGNTDLSVRRHRKREEQNTLRTGSCVAIRNDRDLAIPNGDLKPLDRFCASIVDSRLPNPRRVLLRSTAPSIRVELHGTCVVHCSLWSPRH